MSCFCEGSNVLQHKGLKWVSMLSLAVVMRKVRFRASAQQPINCSFISGMLIGINLAAPGPTPRLFGQELWVWGWLHLSYPKSAETEPDSLELAQASCIIALSRLLNTYGNKSCDEVSLRFVEGHHKGATGRTRNPCENPKRGQWNLLAACRVFHHPHGFGELYGHWLEPSLALIKR